MSISPLNGSTTTQTDNVNVTVNRSALADGSNSGSISISSNGGHSTITVYAEKPTELSVTGRWLNNFDINNTPFAAYTELTQDGTTLTGTWEMTDGSGHQNIGSGSYIDGKSIKITFLVGTYACYFLGTVSDNFQSMSGGFYASGQNVGSWSSTKIGLAKAIDSPYDVPVVEKLKELIEKLK